MSPQACFSPLSQGCNINITGQGEIERDLWVIKIRRHSDCLNLICVCESLILIKEFISQFLNGVHSKETRANRISFYHYNSSVRDNAFMHSSQFEHFFHVSNTEMHANMSSVTII